LPFHVILGLDPGISSISNFIIPGLTINAQALTFHVILGLDHHVILGLDPGILYT